MTDLYDHECTARAPHNPNTFALSLVICVGLAISYAPQHYRIIKNKTSEGFSPWYLLLGATSSASSLLNVFTLQWNVVRCCRIWTPLGCFENALGILQIAIQWFLFNMILVLYLCYFPPELKFSVMTRIESNQAESSLRPRRSASWAERLRQLFWPSFDRPASPKRRKSNGSASSEDEFVASALLPSWNRDSAISYSHEYRLASIVALVVLLHLVVFTFVTFMLLLSLPKSDLPISPDRPEHPSTRLVHIWATFLGVASMILACFQYVPQLLLTFETRLVGSLSIPMMLIQTPGSFVFVYSYLADGGRPGVNWTTWLVYLVTGCFQGLLLLMCCAWKLRQKAAGIDDYGRDVMPDVDVPERQPLLANRASNTATPAGSSVD